MTYQASESNARRVSHGTIAARSRREPDGRTSDEMRDEDCERKCFGSEERSRSGVYLMYSLTAAREVEFAVK